MMGTYVLFLESKKDVEPEVGRLGKIKIPRGLYAYVGSAMGKTINLQNRINRHRRLAEKKKGSKRWHIDYFTTAPGVKITGVVKITGKRIECRLADLMDTCGGKMVAEGFGSSDCKCRTHFFSVTEDVVESFLRSLPDTF